MLYALYKCIDVREIQKGKSMKRKKSTQLLAVALTAAMLAQPVGAQMVFAEGNADAVQQEQAVSPAAETTGAVLKSGTAVIPANADLNQVKEILGKTLVENADQVDLSSLEWEYKCEGKTGLTGLEVSGNESWGSIGGLQVPRRAYLEQQQHIPIHLWQQIKMPHTGASERHNNGSNSEKDAEINFSYINKR